MSQTEPRLVCAGPHPFSERAAAILREEGIDAHPLPVPPVDPFLPVEALASAVGPMLQSQDSEWVLYLRAGELIPRALAREIAKAVPSEPRAFAYRIRRRLFDRTVPLLVHDPIEREGEIRLLHRRRARFQRDGRLTLQGTVIRLIEPLHLEVRESGLTGERSGGIGVIARTLFGRPWLLFHPPTLSFLWKNRGAVSEWRDRVRSDPESRG